MFGKTLGLGVSTIAMLLIAMQAQAAQGFAYISDEHTLGLWHMDEGEGEEIIDASPNKVDGAVEGEAGWTDEEWKKGGEPGKSFVFDGNTVINLGNVNDVQILSAEAVTIEAWIYAEQLSDWNLVFTNWGAIAGRDGGSWHLGVNNAIPRFHVDTGLEGAPVWVDVAAPALELDTWYHIAGTYDSEEGIKLYIDGELAAERQYSGEMWIDNDREIILGSKVERQFKWVGSMDEVRLSDIARTPAELSPNLTAPQATDLGKTVSLAITWGSVKSP